jgi:hypothetical protein
MPDMSNKPTKTNAPSRRTTNIGAAKNVGAKAPNHSSDPAYDSAPPAPAAPRVTRAQTLLTLMRAEGGASAQALGEAVGWQAHSIRGFIAGTLKKRGDLLVTTTRIDGVTRYLVADVMADPA